MAKPKNPFLSLSARGTVGNLLTAQRRNKATMLRLKPTPSDPKSLAQIYQRWDYELYIHFWHQLSEADKQVWNRNARPHHMPGFAYFMRSRLLYLLNLQGRWHLDNVIGNQVPDSSKNSNTGTVYGAIPTTGIISNCLSFDGINDYVNCGSDDSLRPTSALSLAVYYYPLPANQGKTVYLIDTARNIEGYSIYRDNTTIGFRFWKNWGALSTTTFLHGNNDLNRWNSLMATWDGENMRIWWDGELKDTDPATELPPPTRPFCLGARTTTWTYNYAGLIDEALCLDTALPQTLAKILSERRYPL